MKELEGFDPLLQGYNSKISRQTVKTTESLCVSVDTPRPNSLQYIEQVTNLIPNFRQQASIQPRIDE